MYLRYITCLILWIFSTIIGLVIYPILPKDREFKTPRGFGKFKWQWSQDIWGNDVDGLSGDEPYRTKEGAKWFRKYISWWWWSCLRNPSNNFERNIISTKGFITGIKKTGNNTIVTFSDGKKRFFYYNHNLFGYKNCKLGWKFWEDQIKVSEYYEAEFVFF